MNQNPLKNNSVYSKYLSISMLAGSVLLGGLSSQAAAQCPVKGVFLPSWQPDEYRKINGRNNNLEHKGWGAAGKPLIRLKEIGIGKDPLRQPGSNNDLPNARVVSNIVASQNGSPTNSKGLSDMFWLWGQFLDHDITLVHTDANNPANIIVSPDDDFYSQYHIQILPFDRSETINDKEGRHPNSITSYIDGSNIYGSDKGTADRIRSHVGGKLRISDNGLLPKDDNGSIFFLTGDERGNENIALTAMHTLWVREHNLIADALACKYPHWKDKDNRIYKEAKRIVVAELQAITYNEFLPALLGRNALPGYLKNSSGYDDRIKVNISNVFSAAAYRFGHSMLPPSLLLLNQSGSEISTEYVSLTEAFFQPGKVDLVGIEPILHGLTARKAMAVDPMVDHSIHNLLFQIQGESHGLDLAAFNIWRGRDHQIPSYNDVRESLGFSRVTGFNDKANKWQRGFGKKLEEAYDSDPDKIDLWVGGLAEKAAGDALVGKTFKAILLEQFSRLRRGDRFWYENRNYYEIQDIKQFKKIKFSDIIKRNTPIWNINRNVFKASEIHKLGGSRKSRRSRGSRNIDNENRRNRRIRKAIRKENFG